MSCDDYQNHPCVKDYGDLHLDDNYYFYPLLNDKETIIRRALLPDGSEGLIEDSIYFNKENTSQNSFKSPLATKKQPKQRKQTTPKTSRKRLSDEYTEQLIIEVQHRIPLWNFNIPVEERSREIQAKLWEEISAALNGKLSAAEAKIKFKNLRDTDRKIIQAENRASGSAAVTSSEKWKFYHCCEFLRDTCLIRETVSNVRQDDGNAEDDGNTDMDSLIDDSFTVKLAMNIL
ncbi:GSCOCG00009519001-RA-CDS [Cotesia congregata]|nr:GSCOCG00009519001-RA-CDS [Cotesia congregata]